MKNTFEIGQEVVIKSQSDEYTKFVLIVNEIHENGFIDCISITYDNRINILKINTELLIPSKPVDVNKTSLPPSAFQ